MTRYIAQRLLLLPFLLLVYSFVIFVVIQAPPGDFLTSYIATLSASGSSMSSSNPGRSLKAASSSTISKMRRRPH